MIFDSNNDQLVLNGMCFLYGICDLSDQKLVMKQRHNNNASLKMYLRADKNFFVTF